MVVKIYTTLMIHITYHPLKGHAQNCTPPQFNNRFATAGRAYHLRPKSENHLYLKVMYKYAKS